MEAGGSLPYLEEPAIRIYAERDELDPKPSYTSSLRLIYLGKLHQRK
jgi:hypothetical protein